MKQNNNFNKNEVRSKNIVIAIVLSIMIFSIFSYFLEESVYLKKVQIENAVEKTKEIVEKSTKKIQLKKFLPEVSEYIDDNLISLDNDKLTEKAYDYFEKYRSNLYQIKAILKIVIFMIAIIILNIDKFKLHRLKNEDKKLGYIKNVESGKREIRKILKWPENIPKLLIVIIVLGILGMVIVPPIARKLVDTSSIIDNMSRKGMNKYNIFLVYFYIAMINSFIEEIIFRGLGYLELKRYTKEKYANNISAILFAIYHIALVNSFFNIPLVIITVIALYIAGRVLNEVDKKENTIIPGYIIHSVSNWFLNIIAYIILFF